MFILGQWCSRVDTPEGRAEFQKMYDVDFYQYMIEHEVTTITRLYPNHNYAHVVFLEYDGSINQVFSLEEGEHLMVYSDGCMDESHVFNTDGMAFFCLVKDCEQKAMFCAENSPYDMQDDMYENDVELTKEEVFEQLKSYLAAKGIPVPVTDTNVLFVRQL